MTTQEFRELDYLDAVKRVNIAANDPAPGGAIRAQLQLAVDVFVAVFGWNGDGR